MQKTEEVSTKVITTKVRFSYAHVFEPYGMDGQEKKYSVSLVIPKSDKALVDKIKKAIKAATDIGKDSKFGGKIPANLKTPLRDGDEERDDDEVYKGAYFINATSKSKPGIVDKDLNPIMDKEDFYSGCYGRASLNFYPFNTSGSKGIACGLNNLQKLADGDVLSGRSRAEDDFKDEEDDDEDFG